jgi:hypothetical protein
VLPQFGNLQHSFNWLDKDFFVSFAPKARDDVVTTFVTTGNYILQGYNLNSSITRLSNFLGQLGRVDEFWRNDVFGIPELNQT